MKKQINKWITLVLMLMVSIAVNAQDSKKTQSNAKNEDKVTFAVSMHCENCKAKIEKNISWEKGVKDLAVNLDKKTVTIVYNSKKTSEEKLKAAIEKLGYTADKTAADGKK